MSVETRLQRLEELAARAQCRCSDFRVWFRTERPPVERCPLHGDMRPRLSLEIRLSTGEGLQDAWERTHGVLA